MRGADLLRVGRLLDDPTSPSALGEVDRPEIGRSADRTQVAGRDADAGAFADARGVEEHLRRPAVDVALTDHLTHQDEAVALFVFGHGQRGEQSGRPAQSMPFGI